MSVSFHLVVCGSVVPDPLQTLEPVAGPALRNETLLPAILDPFAAHALYEAAAVAAAVPGSRAWLVAVGPRPKLQQVLLTVAQKVPFELAAVDGPANGFTDAADTAATLVETIRGLPGLDPARLLLFGGWESASRGAGATLQLVGERLGLSDQFQGVDELSVQADGSLRVLERVEGGRHLVSVCAGAPAVFGWATGRRPEPPASPQTGMANMRTALPALQRARPAPPPSGDLAYVRVTSPSAKRATKIVRDLPPDEVARDLAAWIRG